MRRPDTGRQQTRARTEESESECRDRLFQKKKKRYRGTDLARRTMPPSSLPELVIRVLVYVLESTGTFIF